MDNMDNQDTESIHSGSARPSQDDVGEQPPPVVGMPGGVPGVTGGVPGVP